MGVGGSQAGSGPSLASVRPALSAAERRILAALSRRPRGLYPVASVAAASGVAEADVRPALERLVDLELVTGNEENVLAKPVRSEVVWRLAVGDSWFAVATEIRSIRLPEPPPEVMPNRLPERFRHLFWSGDPSVVRLPRDAAFVAEQILERHDIGAWGWAVSTLPREALERVAAKRVTSPATRAMIRNALAERDAVAC